MMDCDGKYCTCQVCSENEENGGTCSHCFTCVNGEKADGSVTDCFEKISD